MPKSKDPCKVFACRIQKCLEDHKFQENVCLEEIQMLRDCCKKWSDKSLVCDGMKDGPKAVKA